LRKSGAGFSIVIKFPCLLSDKRMELWLAGAIPKAPDVKVNVCNTILLIFTSYPCSSPLNTNSMSLVTNIKNNNQKIKFILRKM
jgi:hypothetical protein